MSSSEIIEIIDAVCDRAGIVVESVSDLVPAFARHGIAVRGVSAVGCAVFILFSLTYLIYLVKTVWYAFKYEPTNIEPPYSDNVMFGLLIVGVFLVISTGMALTGLIQHGTALIGWLASPEVEMIYEVLKMIP